MLKENKMDVKLIKKFAKFCQKQLNINQLPKIKLTQTRDEIKTTAGYVRGKEIIIYTKGRHIVDVCRSLAHELVHHKQFEDKEFDLYEKIQDVGGQYEDEANAEAGSMIKKFAYAGNMGLYESKNNKPLLSEGRIEDAKRKYPTTSPELIDYISSKDPSGNNKYLVWIIKQLKNQTLINPKFDSQIILDKILAIVEDYNNLLSYYSTSKLVSNDTLSDKIIQFPKDINSYSTVDQLELTNAIIKPYKEEKQNEKDSLKKSKTIYDGDNFLIVNVLKASDVCYFGIDSKWCTSTHETIVRKYLQNFFMFMIIDKKAENQTPYSKLLIRLPKDIKERSKYQIHLSNNGIATLDDIINYNPELGVMFRFIENYISDGNLEQIEKIKHTEPELYALAKYLDDDILKHYKINNGTLISNFTYNNGKTNSTYSIGTIDKVKHVVNKIYQDKVQKHPKIIMKHMELLPQCLNINSLISYVIKDFGFNNLINNTKELQDKIKPLYPMPPMKLKTNNIDDNKFELTKLSDIDEKRNANEVNEKKYKKQINSSEKLIKNITNTINDLNNRIEILKLRSEQIKDDTELINNLQFKIGEYENMITTHFQELKGLDDEKMVFSEKLDDIIKQNNEMSDEYTEILNKIEETNQDKENYEYSPEQISKIKEKIKVDVVSNSIEWTQKLKLTPKELLKMINISKLSEIMSDEFIKNVKSFGNFKFVEKTTQNETAYYIFTNENK